jgi:predicted secreted protein
MKKLTFITAALLMLALPAAADFETVSRAYEVSLDRMTIPATVNSRVMFKDCDSCDTQSIRVTAETRYSVNGRKLRLKKFRQAIRRAPRGQDVPVTVLHHLESDTVLAVSVYIRDKNRD